MSILSVMTPDRFSLAVCTEDAKAISKAPGIGAKTAARIILELKDKISKETMTASVHISTDKASTVPAGANGKLSEATEALMVLGYDRNTILSALKGVDTATLATADIIKAVLKKLAR